MAHHQIRNNRVVGKNLLKSTIYATLLGAAAYAVSLRDGVIDGIETYIAPATALVDSALLLMAGHFSSNANRVFALEPRTNFEVYDTVEKLKADERRGLQLSESPVPRGYVRFYPVDVTGFVTRVDGDRFYVSDSPLKSIGDLDGALQIVPNGEESRTAGLISGSANASKERQKKSRIRGVAHTPENSNMNQALWVESIHVIENPHQ